LVHRIGRHATPSDRQDQIAACSIAPASSSYRRGQRLKIAEPEMGIADGEGLALGALGGLKSQQFIEPMLAT
jgi:hypothetical protein